MPGRSKYKVFFETFESSEIIVRLAIELLSDEDKELLYKKYGENLTNLNKKDNITIGEERKIYITIKTRILKIIDFLKQLKIDETNAEFIINNREEINKIIEKYDKYSKSRTFKSLFENFDVSEVMIRLAINFITEEEKVLLYKKYGTNLTSTRAQEYITEEEKIKIKNILDKIKRIIKKLKSLNVDNNQALMILKDQEKLTKLKEEYNKEKYAKKNKSFLNRFAVSELLVKLAVEFLSEEDKNLLHKKYGENLDDLSLKPELSENEKSKLYYTIINRINKILHYLKTEGIDNDYYTEELLNDKAKLTKLIEKYNALTHKKQNKKNMNLKEQFKYLDENILKLAVLTLNENDRYIIYKKYGEELNENNDDLTENEKNKLENSVLFELTKIITSLKQSKIDENETKKTLTSEEKSTVFIEQTRIKSSTINKNFISYFNVSSAILLLAIKFLKETDQDIIKRKYGEELKFEISNDLSKKEKNRLNVIRKILNKIIEFIEEKEIDEEKAEYLLNNEEELKILIKEYKKSKAKKLYTFYNINTNTVVLTLAVELLNENEKLIIYKKYGENLNEVNTISKEENTKSYYIIEKIRNIMNFLNQNKIGEEESSIIIKNKELLEELKNKYNNPQKVDFKKGLSILKETKEKVLLATKLLNENERKLINRYFGENLENKNILLTQKEKKELYKIIGKIRQILIFINKNNINSDKAIEILNNPPEIEKLVSLYNNGMYKSLFSYFKAPIYLVKLSVLMLDSNIRNILYKKYGINLEDNLIKEDFDERDNIFLEKTIIPKMKKIINFLKLTNISEKEAQKIIDEFDVQSINSLKDRFENHQELVENKIQPSSVITAEKTLFSIFNEKEVILKLALELLYKSEKDYLIEILKDGKLKLLIKEIERNIEYIKSKNISISDAMYYLSTTGSIDLEKLKNDLTKQRTPLIEEKASDYLYSYFNETENKIKLALLFLSNLDRERIYSIFGKNLSHTFIINNDIYLKNKIIPELTRVLKFLNARNITEKEINYLLSKDGTEYLEMLINAYKMDQNMRISILNELKNLVTTEKFKKLSDIYGDEIALGLLGIEYYGYHLTINVISDIVGVSEDKLMNLYMEYKSNNKLTLK